MTKPKKEFKPIFQEPKIKFTRSKTCPICKKNILLDREKVITMIEREFRTMFFRCDACDEQLVYELKTGK